MDLGNHCSIHDRLLGLNLLPLCLHIEMHDILFLLALIRNEYDVKIQPDFDESAETTRPAQRGEFKVPKSRLRKTIDYFFRRTKILFNYVLRVCKDCGTILYKTTLKRIYHRFFEKFFNVDNKCTWKIMRRCGHCNALNKLKLN